MTTIEDHLTKSRTLPAVTSGSLADVRRVDPLEKARRFMSAVAQMIADDLRAAQLIEEKGDMLLEFRQNGSGTLDVGQIKGTAERIRIGFGIEFRTEREAADFLLAELIPKINRRLYEVRGRTGDIMPPLFGIPSAVAMGM